MRVVVGAYLCRAVASAHESAASAGDVVDILLVLLVIDEGAQSCQGALFVLGLVACLGTLDEDLLLLAGVRVGPHVAQAHSRVHLVDVLSTSAATAEGVPLDLALIDLDVERLGLGKDGDRCRRGVDAALCLGHGHTLHAVDTALILQRAIDAIASDAEHNLLVSAGSTLATA